MAIIEVCDICRNEVAKNDGISVNCSDMNGLKFVFGDPYLLPEKRKYKVRICDKCKENIIKYCKENR